MLAILTVDYRYSSRNSPGHQPLNKLLIFEFLQITILNKAVFPNPSDRTMSPNNDESTHLLKHMAECGVTTVLDMGHLSAAVRMPSADR